MWSVLGLSRQDALLAALPLESTPQLQALQYAAMAAGAPALFPGDDPDAVASAARLAPPSVFAAAPEQAGALLEELAGVGAPLSGLTTVLLVGRPTDEQRAAALAAAARAGAANVVALSVYAPAGGRLLWAECRQSAGATGLHTYPDHDLVQVVDPETGEETAGAGELVLTQLGMRGTALLRWRTGDLVEGIDQARCAGCGRNVARILGLVPGVLVVPTDRGRNLDLRAVAGALTGRPDITDWRVVVGGRSRDGKGQVVVHVATSGDPGAVTVAAASDIRAVAGLLPTQLVAGSAADISAVHGQPLTRRILLRR
jgi:phenylacetate-CoA ligase